MGEKKTVLKLGIICVCASLFRLWIKSPPSQNEILRRGIANSNAPGSICPKNWHLPISGTQYNGTSGSFYYLLNKYGLTSNVAGTGQDGNNYNIASPPLSFVRSGHVGLGDGSLRGFGLDGYGWSSASGAFPSVTSATAYYLYFGASGVYPSRGPGGRWNGFPIRCLAY